MTYATVADLINRYSAEELAQVADRGIPRIVTPELLTAVANQTSLDGFTAEQLAAADAAIDSINVALNDATDTIHSYLAARYGMPLASVPPIITRTVCDLARYYLFKDQVTERMTQAHNAATKWLEQARDGKVTIGIAPIGGQQPETSNGAEMHSSETVFNRDRSKGFI
jgi:phage gp36-like protein